MSDNTTLIVIFESINLTILVLTRMILDHRASRRTIDPTDFDQDYEGEDW